MSRRILKNTAIFSAFTVLAQVLAVLRDVVLVRVAGVGPLLDTYYMAFKIPDLLSGFYMIFLGSVVFIPLITKAEKEGGQKEVVRKLSEIGTFVFLVIGALFLIIYFALPSLAQILVPQWDLSQQLQMVNLSRILLFSQLIFPLGIIGGALCMVYGRVGFTAISSALYNLGILCGAFFLFPIWGIYGVAVGVILGSVMFFFVQAVPSEVRNILQQIRPNFHFQTVKNFVQTNISRFFSVFLWQVFLLLLLYVASKYGESSVSVFNIAYGIDVSLIAIIGTSVSSVMLPIFARLHIDQDEQGLSNSLNNSTLYTIYISLIISYFLFLFSPNWIALLYHFSKIDPEKLLAISSVFAIFMLSLPLQNNFEIVRRYLYSTEKVNLASIITTSFMFVLFAYVFLVRKYWPIDSVAVLAYAFLFSNIVSYVTFLTIYKRQMPINYLNIFHNLLPLLISIPLSALIWYATSMHTQILSSDNNLIFLLKNNLFVLIILLILLYLLRDKLIRGLVHKLR